MIASVQAFSAPGNLVETVTYHYTAQYASGIVYVTFWDLTQVDYDDGTHAFYTYFLPGEANSSAWSLSPGPIQSWTMSALPAR